MKAPRGRASPLRGLELLRVGELFDNGLVAPFSDASSSVDNSICNQHAIYFLLTIFNGCVKFVWEKFLNDFVDRSTDLRVIEEMENYCQNSLGERYV